MATELIVRRAKNNPGLWAASPADLEAMDGLSMSVDYRAILTRAQGRSILQHRLLWGLAKLVSENLDCEPPLSAEGVVALLKLRTGHTTPVRLASGEDVLIPNSLSFAKCDQDVFNRFFEKALAVVERDLIPGLSSDVARREIEAAIAGKQAA